MDFGSTDFLNVKSIIGNLGSINGGVGNDGKLNLLNDWFTDLAKGWDLGSTISL